MALFDPLTANLDNLRFQKDLVDEARKRIVRYCPEWTEYNVSDPGITLIELFAWMTEQIIYRLNLTPRKNYVKFLEMLGITLAPPASATTPLTFYLSTPFPLRPGDPTGPATAVIPGNFQVATVTPPDGEAVIFTTDQALAIVSPELKYLCRERFQASYWHPKGAIDFVAYEPQPRPSGWAYFYLGFDPKLDSNNQPACNISGHILRLHIACEAAQGSGIDRERPPWLWRACTGTVAGTEETPESLGVPLPVLVDAQGNHWQRIDLGKTPEEKDTTGGLNNEMGSVTLYLPPKMEPVDLHGMKAYWVRCGLQTAADPLRQSTTAAALYTAPPVIKQMRVEVLGAQTQASNAVLVENEELGRSSGDPGQVFYLKYKPVLAPQYDNSQPHFNEVVEVEEWHDEGGQYHDDPVYIPWRQVCDFADSTRHDRHYMLDIATGEIRFGPAVRGQDGSVRQYGRIPPMSMRLRMRRYRYSSGVRGNVPQHQLRVLRSNLPYIDRVTNWVPVANGRDVESLEEAMLRAQRLMRAQNRAVTAADYELLAKQEDRAIARVKCLEPQQTASNSNLAPGQVVLLVVPAVYEAVAKHDFLPLALSADLQRRIRNRLEPLRVLTTTFLLQRPQYLGIFVNATIVVDERYDPQRVVTAVNRMLCNYLTPLRPIELPNPELGETPDPHKVAIVIDEASDPDLIEAQVKAALTRFKLQSKAMSNGQPSASLLPASQVAPDRAEPQWDGWSWGEPLRKPDLMLRMQKVAGVKQIKQLDLYKLRCQQDDLVTLQELRRQSPLVVASPLQTGEVKKINDAADTYEWELVVGDHFQPDPGTLLCSPINHLISLSPF